MSDPNHRNHESIHLGLDLLAHVSPYDARRRWLGPRSYWLCQALGWGGMFLLFIAPLPFKARITGTELLCHFLFVLAGLLVSHLLRVAILHALENSKRLGVLVVRTLVWLSLAILCHVILHVNFTKQFASALNSSSGGTYEDTSLLFIFADNVSLSAGIFVVWLVFYFALLTYRRYQAIRIERLQLAADVQEAAWKALQSQLNPHLLFNSLNSIRALIPRDLQAPRDALTHLSDLLRSSLTLKQSELIPLKREMETVESFLSLEALRFEKRLRITQSIEDACWQWQVPPFLVQTLIENAVKYGVAPYEEGGDISLKMFVEEEVLHLELVNRGQLHAAAAESSTGLGLRNLRSRLAILFGPSCSLVLENFGPERVRALVRLPRQPLKIHAGGGVS